MAFKPHRPIRVGTKMMVTDADGRVPSGRHAPSIVAAPDPQPIGGGQPSESQLPQPPQPAMVLGDLTRAQLLDLAKQKGLEVKGNDSKATLIVKLEKAPS